MWWIEAEPLAKHSRKQNAMRKRVWDRCQDTVAMLEAIHWPLTKPSSEYVAAINRRFRLFTLEMAKPVLNRLKHPVCNSAAVVLLRHAEGTASPGEVSAIHRQLEEAYDDGIDAATHYAFAPLELWRIPRLTSVLALLLDDPHSAARNLIVPMQFVWPGEEIPLLTPTEVQAGVALMREFFGLPGVELDRNWWKPEWSSSTVVGMARYQYKTQDFSPMPILADALQEAGCEDPDVLKHCRGPGPHRRGCWVLDLILGKV